MGVSSCPPASAQISSDDRTRELVRRAQQAIKKVEQEKAALQRELRETKDKLAAAQSEIEVAKVYRSRADAAERAATALRAESGSAQRDATEKGKQASELRERVDAMQAEIAALRDKLKGAEQTAEGRAQQNRQLVVRGATQEKRVASCEAANVKLYEAARECIVRFEREALTGYEPFTQLQRVKIENLLEQYRDRFDENRVGAEAR